MDARFQSLLADDGARHLFEALSGHEKNGEVRFIGGCVRDALLERPIGDIDLTTTLVPQDVIARLNAANIPVIPTGLDHGTVTALWQKTPYEITTLRRDVATDGRRATVAFSTDWQEDSWRRDFTVNALSLDESGMLHDYHHGQDDLENRHLRFIGDAAQRIAEDALRILRFFRFASVLDWDIRDQDGLDACIKARGLLNDLSRERVQSELFKLLQGRGCVRVLRIMAEQGILDELIPSLSVDRLEELIALEHRHQEASPFRRLLALAGWQDDPDFIVLSREQKRLLQALRNLASQQLAEHWAVDKILYFYGVQTTKEFYYLVNPALSYDHIVQWQKPEFPLKADDLIRHFGWSGPQLGQKLEEAEHYWADHEFQPEKDELLTLLTPLA